MGNLRNIHGPGYCIVCGIKVKQDVNSCLCVQCKLDNPINKFAEKINGTHCHYCRIQGKYSNIEPRCQRCFGHDRESNKIDDFYNESLDRYQNIEKQSIKILWDFEEAKRNMSWNRRVVRLPVKELISITKLSLELNSEDVFSNEIKYNKRILNTLDRWAHNLVITPPTIKKENGEYTYIDGRHRTLAAYYLNEDETIPVIVEYKQ